MASTLFKDTTYSLSGLVEDIKRGEVALPDIQRPFVWQASKVRDLFDSMYRGFPVGYLLFWATGADAGVRQIGVEDKQAVPRLLIVDGQQRLTSLYAVFTGTKVIREDYSEARIRVGFRPTDQTFVVTDAAVEKDPEFIADITRLWTGVRKQVVRGYLDALRTKRPVDQDEADALEEAIDGVYDLVKYPFKVVELAADVDEEQVAEIFVRINSEGVKLNRADFILTLMSVFWDKGRRELEDFSRAAKTPSLSGASPFNWFLRPQPPQLLRVSIALAFRRAVLKTVYGLLRGKDLDTGVVSAASRDAQFNTLRAAQAKVLDLTNWHEFMQCLERAGFRSDKMISSDNAVLFSYAMWLIGRVDHGMSVASLREVIARWFFMVHTTARYSGSFESQFESDVARLEDVKDAAGFTSMLDRVVEDTLSSDFWTITLPNQLGTSASKGPALSAYMAALNILDADALMGTGKVRSRLDPAIVAKRGIERHHLFPKAHLRDRLKITDVKLVNQIANMSFVEWMDNGAVSDDPPDTYWPAMLTARKFSDTTLAQQIRDHALPPDWTSMAYLDFLAARRKLMGEVVRTAFEQLRASNYSPAYPTVSTPAPAAAAVVTTQPGQRLTTISDLIEAGVLAAGDVLLASDDSALATVLEDGRLDVDGKVFDSPDQAAVAITQTEVDGWTFWMTERAGMSQPLAHLTLPAAG